MLIMYEECDATCRRDLLIAPVPVHCFSISFFFWGGGMKADTLNRLRRNYRAIIRWICNIKAKDEVSSDSLLTKLGIQDLDVVLRTSRMRWS